MSRRIGNRTPHAGAGVCERLVRRVVGNAEIAEGLIGDVAEETERATPRPLTPIVYRLRLLGLAAAYRIRGNGAGGADRAPSDGPAARGIRVARTAARGLRHDGRVLAAAVLTLALGVGAATAVYAIVETVLLRDLPYRDPDRLVFLRADVGADRNTGVIAEQTFLDIQESSERARWAGVGPEAVSPVQVDGVGFGLTSAYVTLDLFPLLGLDPIIGRHFDESDLTGRDAETPAPVLLSHAAWGRLFGHAPDAVGRVITTGGVPYRIIGVLPAHAEIWLGPGTSLSSDVDFWWLYQPFGGDSRRSTPVVRAVGRLASGATLEQLQVEVTRATGFMRESFPDIYGDTSHRVVSLHGDLVAEVRTPMLALGALVITVMLIAAANAAGLLLARARAREPLVSIKRALGASSRQILAELAAEAALLALLVGGAGLALAWALFRLLAGAAPASIPRIGDAAFDPTIAAVGAILAVGTTTLATLLPAVQCLQVQPGGVLRAAADRFGGGRLRVGTRRALLAGQIALSMVLLVSAGRLADSLMRMSRVDPGFDAASVVVLDVQDHEFAFRSEVPFGEREAALEARADRTYAGLEALDSVASASGGYQAPFGTFPLNWSYYGSSESDLVDGARRARSLIVAPGYFDALGVPLLEGRDFTWGDASANGAEVAIVTPDIVEDLWPGQSPLGRRLRLSSGSEYEIVGVVRASRVDELRGAPGPQIYTPGLWVTQSIVARAAGDPQAAIGMIRGYLEAEAPWLSISAAEPMGDALARATADLRFVAFVVGSLAIAGLLLTCAGLFALGAFVARTRRHDTAVRMALGAQQGAIVGLALHETIRFVLVGVVAGLVGSVWASRLLSDLMLDVGPAGPAALIAATLIIVAASLAAAAVPAYGACRAGSHRLLRDP